MTGMSDAEKVEFLEKRLADEEAKAVKAATIGKQLFTELNETKAKLSELQTRNGGGTRDAMLSVEASEVEQRVESLETTLEAKEDELRSLRNHYESREAQHNGLVQELQSLRHEKNELVQQLTSMESQHGHLQEQLDEYELRVSGLSEALETSKKELERLRRIEGKAIKTARETGSEIEASKQESQQLRDQIEEMQKLENKLLQDNRKLELQVAQLTTELTTQREAESNRNDPLQKQVTRLTEAVRDAKTEAETLRMAAEQLEAEKSKLAAAVSTLTRENRNLIKEREENLSFLNEARASVNALLAKQIEHSAITEGALDASLVDPMMDNSLLGELEKELTNRLKSEPEGEPIKQAQNGGGFSGEEEYFFWLISAIKTNLLMKHPHHSDGVAMVQPRVLYQEIKENSIDYYEWHHWLEEKLLLQIHVAPLPSKFKETPLASKAARSSAASASTVLDLVDETFL